MSSSAQERSEEFNRRVDFDRTASDYSRHRAGFPSELFDRLQKYGVGLAGQRVQVVNGVVVIGEQPYAEGNGDLADLKLAQEDIDAVTNMKAAGIPEDIGDLPGGGHEGHHGKHGRRLGDQA